MISAKEAREETIRCREKLLENEIQYVEDCIKKAINKGEFVVGISAYLSSETVNTLEMLNYDVVRDFSRGRGYTTICWNN